MRTRALVFVALGLISAAAAAQGPPGVTYLFFDWGKSELSGDSRQALDMVAAAYAEAPRPLLIDGHSDRSGPAPANLSGSRRRAEIVRDYLAAKGVPPGALRVRAFGESRSIVPTEDGVREAQNRRVEIRDDLASKQQAIPSAPFVRSDASAAGTARIVEAGEGARIFIDAKNLPPGTHGLHLHAVGRCDAPDFTSAGPHWNPTNTQHGRLNPQGPHLGDLPSLTVASDGTASATITIQGSALRPSREHGSGPAVFDADGTALAIHAGPDDNRTDPGGNSGGRIACAVLAAPGGA